MYSSVVPVLPNAGRVHPNCFAAAAAVPWPWSSSLNPTARAFANASSTTCSHGGSVSCTGFPYRSRIASTGDGWHHLPPDISVAATFASSNVLVGAGLNVNDAFPADLKNSDCVTRSSFCFDFLSGGTPAMFVAIVSRMPNLDAMSTTASNPTFSSRITNAVFGDVANACFNVIRGG